MKYKQITILTIFITLLFVFSLSVVSAADQTIDNSTGISTGITNTGDGDTLTLQEGIYNKSNDRGITINKNITIQGNSSTDKVIFDAQGLNRIFTIGNNMNVTFINLTFINGYTTGNGGAIYNNYANSTITFINCTFINNTANQGGAIYNSGVNFSVSNSTFTNNTATRGGAIYNTGSSAINFSVSNSTFTNNTATGSGGAIRNSGAGFSVNNSTFTENIALGTGSINGGGAIRNSGAGFSVNNSNFTGNTATSGGAIYNYGGANCSVSNSTFTNNTATSNGGAIRNNNNNFSVSNSTFTENTATGSGGAIYNTGGSDFSVSNSTFTNNTATGSGGAIYNTGGSDFSVSNSTFTNNTATGSGGAIYNTGGRDCSVSNSTFTNNTATGSGGAIRNSGAGFSVNNSTFTENIALGTGSINGGGAIRNSGAGFSVNNSNFTGNTANSYGGAIYNSGGMLVFNNTMSGNNAISNGPMIYNSGRMGVLNLTYLGNSTVVVSSGSVVLYAFLTDDMGNTVSGQRVYFYVNGTLVGSAISDRNGRASISFSVPKSWRPSLVNVTGDYDGHTGYSINIFGGELDLPLLDKIETKTTLIVSNSIVKVGTTITISGVVTNEFNDPLGNIVITVTVGGETFYVTTNSSGQWSLSYIANVSGDFEIMVSWDGNDTHTSFVNITELTVNQLVSNSTVNVSNNGHVGNSITISGIAKDENGNLITNTLIQVMIEDADDNSWFFNVMTNSTGGWNVTFIPPSTGNFIVTVSWNGNSTHFDFTNTTTFSVAKAIANSTVVVGNGKIGQQSTISGVAIDENGNPIANTELTVTINGVIYTVITDGAGAWSLNYTPSVSGSLNVIVSWTGSDTHNGFINSTVFNVANAGTNSTIIVVNSTVGKSTTINGTASDENGNVLASVTVTVTVNGIDYTVTTDTFGFWSLTYIPNVAGSLTVQVNWTGNATHNGFVNTTVLNVTRAATNSTINASASIVGKNVTINGTAVDENGNLLANVQLNVTINGIVHTVTTNGAGFWNLTYLANTSGTFTIQVSYLGNTTHFSFVNTTSFNVANASTNSTIIVVNSTVGKSTTINGTASDENGNVLAGVQLTVTVNGIAYNVMTNGVGFWSLSYIPNVAGNLNVVASWIGNATHNGFSNTTVLNVTRAATNSTINVSGSTVGKNVTINGTAVDENGNFLVGVQLNVTIGSTVYTVTTNGAGVWNLTYTPTLAGSLSIQVSYLGNTTHYDFTNSTSFNVAKAIANSTIIVVNSTVGKSTIINGTATDSNGNSLASVTLTVTVNGMDYNVLTNGVGFWSLSYIPNVTGALTVQVNWTGNTTHNGFVNTTVLNVTRAATNSTINVSGSTVGKNVTINGTALDENGNLLSGVTLNVTVGGTVFTVTTNGVGFWSLTYVPTLADSLSIQVSYLGNTTHYGFVNSTSFNVANAGANSTIITSNSTVGKSTTINGIGTDENGNFLANTQLNVTVNGVIYTVTTNTLGVWSLSYIPNVVGSLNVQVSWAGNGTHYGFSNITVLNVSKASTNSTIITVNTKIGQQSTKSGVVTDENNNPLANTQITVIVNGTSYNVTTNAGGTWILNYIPNVSGSLSVVVSWEGNSTHNGFSNTTNFNVANAGTNSTIIVVNSTVGKSTTINGTAIDENNNPLVNTQITITVNGTSYNVTTNAAGVWSLSYIPNVSGSLSVVVSWEGNSTHNGFTNSTSFSVVNAATNSTINVPNTNAGQLMNIIGIASDENGNPLANIQITVIINGTSYSVTTDNTGMWSLTYTPTHEGIFELTLSWAGNSTHNGFTNSTEFSVPKIPANTTINALDTKAKQSINITGLLTDVNGNSLADAELTITIDGESFTVINDNNGEWTLTYTPQRSGVFNVIVSYEGNNIYLNFTNSTSFNVAKLNTNITINTPVNATVGEETMIFGTLTDELGNPIANANLEITIDGKNYIVTTNNNGTWILKYLAKNSGIINVSISFNGNGIHEGFVKSISFKVNKGKDPKIINETKKTKLTLKVKGSKITATLIDEDGNTLKGKDIIFRSKGEIIGIGTTDSKGRATIYFKDAYKYKINAKFEGDDKYYPSSAEYIPKESNNPTKTKNNNKDISTITTKAIMKKTGIPIILILLILFSLLGTITLKKKTQK